MLNPRVVLVGLDCDLTQLVHGSPTAHQRKRHPAPRSSSRLPVACNIIVFIVQLELRAMPRGCAIPEA